MIALKEARKGLFFCLCLQFLARYRILSLDGGHYKRYIWVIEHTKKKKRVIMSGANEDANFIAHFAVMYMEAFSASEAFNRKILRMSLDHVKFLVEHAEEGPLKRMLEGITADQTLASWAALPALYRERKEKAEAEAARLARQAAERPALLAAYNARLAEYAQVIQQEFDLRQDEHSAISEGCRTLKAMGVSISVRKDAVHFWKNGGQRSPS